MPPTRPPKRALTSPANKDGKKAKEEDCVICCKPATENVMECMWCEARLHATCAKISDDLCILIGNNTNHIVFLCSPCFEALPTAFHFYDGFSDLDSRVSNIEELLEKQSSDDQSEEVQQFTSQHKELSNQISDLTSRINQVVTFNNKLQGQIEDINAAIHTAMHSEQPMSVSSPAASPTPISEESVARLASSLVVEQREKEKRQLNIILHNLPESTAPEGVKRKEDDIKRCVSIFQEYLGPSVSITKAIRIGRKSEKTRLLKLTLSSMQDKSLILKNKLKLRSSGNPEYIRKLFVTPDLTPGEQKRHKELRLQLADMNKEGNTFMIKNGRIVQRPT